MTPILIDSKGRRLSPSTILITRFATDKLLLPENKPDLEVVVGVYNYLSERTTKHFATYLTSDRVLKKNIKRKLQNL